MDFGRNGSYDRAKSKVVDRRGSDYSMSEGLAHW